MRRPGTLPSDKVFKPFPTRSDDDLDSHLGSSKLATKQTSVGDLTTTLLSKRFQFEDIEAVKSPVTMKTLNSSLDSSTSPKTYTQTYSDESETISPPPPPVKQLNSSKKESSLPKRVPTAYADIEHEDTETRALPPIPPPKLLVGFTKMFKNMGTSLRALYRPIPNITPPALDKVKSNEVEFEGQSEIADDIPFENESDDEGDDLKEFFNSPKPAKEVLKVQPEKIIEPRQEMKPNAAASNVGDYRKLNTNIESGSLSVPEVPPDAPPKLIQFQPKGAPSLRALWQRKQLTKNSSANDNGNTPPKMGFLAKVGASFRFQPPPAAPPGTGMQEKKKRRKKKKHIIKKERTLRPEQTLKTDPGLANGTDVTGPDEENIPQIEMILVPKNIPKSNGDFSSNPGLSVGNVMQQATFVEAQSKRWLDFGKVKDSYRRLKNMTGYGIGSSSFAPTRISEGDTRRDLSEMTPGLTIEDNVVAEQQLALNDIVKPNMANGQGKRRRIRNFFSRAVPASSRHDH